MGTSTKDQHRVGGISIHAVDIARGVPAAGLNVRLVFLDEARREIARGQCNDDGLLQHPIIQGIGTTRGMYEVEFDVGPFYRMCGVEVSDPSFLEIAIFRFGINHLEEHFHLPFKFTPWGFSLFRGGA